MITSASLFTSMMRRGRWLCCGRRCQAFIQSSLDRHRRSLSFARLAMDRLVGGGRHVEQEQRRDVARFLLARTVDPRIVGHLAHQARDAQSRLVVRCRSPRRPQGRAPSDTKRAGCAEIVGAPAAASRSSAASVLLRRNRPRRRRAGPRAAGTSCADNPPARSPIRRRSNTNPALRPCISTSRPCLEVGPISPSCSRISSSSCACLPLSWVRYIPSPSAPPLPFRRVDLRALLEQLFEFLGRERPCRRGLWAACPKPPLNSGRSRRLRCRRRSPEGLRRRRPGIL